MAAAVALRRCRPGGGRSALDGLASRNRSAGRARARRRWQRGRRTAAAARCAIALLRAGLRQRWRARSRRSRWCVVGRQHAPHHFARRAPHCAKPCGQACPVRDEPPPLKTAAASPWAPSAQFTHALAPTSSSSARARGDTGRCQPAAADLYAPSEAHCARPQACRSSGRGRGPCSLAGRAQQLARPPPSSRPTSAPPRRTGCSATTASTRSEVRRGRARRGPAAMSALGGARRAPGPALRGQDPPTQPQGAARERRAPLPRRQGREGPHHQVGAPRHGSMCATPALRPAAACAAAANPPRKPLRPAPGPEPLADARCAAPSAVLDDSASSLFVTEVFRGMAYTLKAFFDPKVTVSGRGGHAKPRGRLLLACRPGRARRAPWRRLHPRAARCPHARRRARSPPLPRRSTTPLRRAPSARASGASTCCGATRPARSAASPASSARRCVAPPLRMMPALGLRACGCRGCKPVAAGSCARPQLRRAPPTRSQLAGLVMARKKRDSRRALACLRLPSLPASRVSDGAAAACCRTGVPRPGHHHRGGGARGRQQEDHQVGRAGGAASRRLLLLLQQEVVAPGSSCRRRRRRQQLAPPREPAPGHSAALSSSAAALPPRLTPHTLPTTGHTHPQVRHRHDQVHLLRLLPGGLPRGRHRGGAQL
jgi:hypothetical protein